jgi:pimeloyl-ACP methyl ester carboxylesterase
MRKVSQFKLINGLEVRNIKGKGPPAIFLHGGPGVYGYIEELCHLVSGAGNIFYYNQRGSKQGVGIIKIENHIADLDQIVSQLGSETKPIIVGHSWGAMLGILFAGRYSDRIEKLILIGSGPLNSKQEKEFFENLDERFGDEKEYYDKLWRIVEEESDSQKKQTLANDYIDKITQFYLYDKSCAVELKDMFYDFEALNETMVDMDNLKRTGEYVKMLSNISVPITCMHGDSDPVSPKSLFQLIKKYHPSAETYEFKNCGHYPWLENCRGEFLAVLKNQIIG